MEKQYTNERNAEELILEIEELVKALKKRKEQLPNEQSVVDKERCDIEHYIEFNCLSASEGYKAYRMLKDCLDRRRAIKNEMEMIDSALRISVSNVKPARVAKIIHSPENKKYEPRVRKELFEN